MALDPGDELADYFAALLRVPRGQISTMANVLDLGADSIMLLEARSWIEARYGRRIEIRRFFEDLNTIDAIAAFLAESQAEAQAGAQVEAPAAIAEAPASSATGRPSGVAGDIALMRSQLALVAEVIEAQNRLAATWRRRSEGRPMPASPPRDGAVPAGRLGDPAIFQGTEITVA